MAFDPNEFSASGFNPNDFSVDESEDVAQARASREALGPETDLIKEAREQYELKTGEEVTHPEAFAKGAIASVTLDFDDEIAGAWRAARAKWKEGASPEEKRAFWDYYRFFRDMDRAHKEEAQRQHLGSYIAGEVAGGIPYAFVPGAGGAKTAADVGKLAKIGAAAGKVALKAVPQAVGMEKGDLTKGEVVKAAGETVQNVALATALHGVIAGGVAGVKNLASKRSEAAVAKFVDNVKDTDAFVNAEETLTKHADAEAIVAKMVMNPKYTPSPEEMATLSKRGAKTHGDDVMKRATWLTSYAGGETAEDVTAGINYEAKLLQEGRGTRKQGLIEAGGASERALYDLENAATLEGNKARNSALALAKAAQKRGISVDRYVGERWLEETLERLNKDIGEDRLKNLVAQAKDDVTPLADTLKNFRLAQEIVDHSGHLGSTLGRSDNAAKRVAAKLIDGREYYIGLERRHGIPFVDTIDAMTRKLNRFNVFRSEQDMATRSFDADYRKALKAGDIDETWLARMSELTPEEFEATNLSPTQMKLWSNFKGIMDNLKDEFKMTQQQGKAFYFPRVLRDSRYIAKDLYAGVKGAEKLVGKSLGTWSNDDMAKALKDERFSSIFDGITYLRGGERSRPKNVLELQSAVSEMMDPRILERSITANTRAVNERLAESMPLWLRETNASSTIRKYMDATGQYKAVQDDLGKLEAFATALEARGDNAGARYVREHVVDLKGGVGREGTVASAISSAERNWINFWDKQSVSATNPALQKTAELMGDLPDAMHFAMQNMYPVFLGARLDAPIRNLGGAYAQVIGELGEPRYANKLAMTGAWQALQKGSIAKLKAKGIIPPERTAEYLEIVRRTYSASPTSQAISRANDRVNNAMMSLFTLSEQAARATTHFMGEGLASDLATAFKKGGAGLTKDEAAATRILTSNFSALDRRAISKMLAEDNVEGVKELVSARLVAKTQFNYNKANASAFAREVGPYFAMFTKWPTSIAGDVANIALNPNAPAAVRARKLMTKYLAPLGVFGAIGQLLPGEKEFGEREDYENVRGSSTVGQRAAAFTLGKGAMYKYAPITAPFGGGLGTSPLYDTAKKTLAAGLKDADAKDKLLGFTSAAAPLMPMGVLFKFANDVHGIFTEPK